MKNNTIGIFNFDNTEVLDDNLTLSIDLGWVSNEIEDRLNKAIKNANELYDKEMPTPWNGAESIIDYMGLTIDITEEETEYRIYAGFHSADDECLCDDVSIRIALSEEDAQEFKKLAAKAVIEKFF